MIVESLSKYEGVPIMPTVLPKWLYEHGKSLGYDMSEYVPSVPLHPASKDHAWLMRGG